MQVTKEAAKKQEKKRFWASNFNRYLLSYLPLDLFCNALPPHWGCILKDRFLYQHPLEMLFTVLGNCCHPHLCLDTFLIAGGNKCSSNITSPSAPFNKNAKLYKAFKIPSESEKTWNRSWSRNRIDLHWFPNENQFNYFSWCIASRQASNSVSTSII